MGSKETAMKSKKKHERDQLVFLSSLFTGLISAIFLNGCTLKDAAAVGATMVGSGMSENKNQSANESNFQTLLRIDSPPENSQISNDGFILSGTCNVEGGLIQIEIGQDVKSSANCYNGRWFSTKIDRNQIPKGIFQIFVRLKDKDTGAALAQWRLRN